MKILLAIVILLVAIPVSAEGSYGVNGESLQNKAKEVRDTLNEQTERLQLHIEDNEEAQVRQENREVRRIQLKEKHEERVHNSIQKIGDNFDLIVKRFENIVNRFESRLDKFDELGVDTTETRELLATSIDEIDNLKDIISDSQSTLEELISREVSIEDIRSEVKSVKDAVNLTRDLITDALNSFKASVQVDTTTSDEDNE